MDGPLDVAVEAEAEDLEEDLEVVEGGEVDLEGPLVLEEELGSDSGICDSNLWHLNIDKQVPPSWIYKCTSHGYRKRQPWKTVITNRKTSIN